MECAEYSHSLVTYTHPVYTQSVSIHLLKHWYTQSVNIQYIHTLSQCTVKTSGLYSVDIQYIYYTPNMKSSILNSKLYSGSVPNRLIQAVLLDKYCRQSNIEYTDSKNKFTTRVPFQFDQGLWCCVSYFSSRLSCENRKAILKLTNVKWPCHLYESERIHAMSIPSCVAGPGYG